MEESNKVREVFKQIIDEHKPFLDTVCPMVVARDLAREDVRKILRMAADVAYAEERDFLECLNIPPTEVERYVRFMLKYILPNPKLVVPMPQPVM